MDTALPNYFGTLARTALAAAKGLRVTFVTMLRPAVTVRYPEEKLRPFPGFRGALLYDASACRACGLCAKACPSGCIGLGQALDESGKKCAKAAWFSVDLGKCSFCRLCEEACPAKPKALWHSADYELVFSSREDMTRCWKPGFGPYGRVFEKASGEFVEPKGQVRLQDPPERR